jgi:hypothetical protein
MRESDLFAAYGLAWARPSITEDSPMPATSTEDHVFEFPPTVEPGTHRAVFGGCREITYEDRLTKESKSLIVWAFLITTGEGADESVVTVDGVTSYSLSVRSKGFEWLSAIAPEIVAERRSVAASELIGRECIVAVEDVEGEAKVGAVLAAPKASRK